jgi:hypothetical protein
MTIRMQGLKFASQARTETNGLVYELAHRGASRRHRAAVRERLLDDWPLVHGIGSVRSGSCGAPYG